MGWLWPEPEPRRARWSLNSTMRALRKMMGGCLTSLPASETPLFKGDGYMLSLRILLSADTNDFDYYCYERGFGSRRPVEWRRRSLSTKRPRIYTGATI